MNQHTKYLKIFANLLTGLLVLVFVFYVCPKIMVFFMPFVVGWIISVIANPMVKFLEKRVKIIRKHSSMIIIIGVLAVVILIIYFASLKVGREGIKFIENLPQMYDDLSAEVTEVWNDLQIVINRLPVDIQKSINEITKDFSSFVSGLVQAVGQPTFKAAGNFAKNVPGTLIAIIMSILSAYFFTADREKLVKGFEKLMPEAIKSNVLQVLSDLKRVVGGYFIAQFKIMAVVFLILLVGLFILQVNYVILVAFIIAFLDMLPVLGTGTVLGPWAVLKILSGDLKMAIGLVILYAVTQLVRQLIQPKIVGDTIGADPLATLIVMYIGYRLSGVTGMIIAVPVGVIIINFYRRGVFDNQIRGIKELVHDFNKFRRF